MNRSTRVCRWVLLAGFVAAALTGIVLLAGGYNVAATSQHTRPVYAMLELASRNAIAWRARNIVVPALDAPEALARGGALYRQHCVSCHGAPGVAPEAFALGLLPVPANLAQVARSKPAREVFWVITYGLKMTGMPAWAFRLDEADRWAVTAFVMQLPTFTPQRYAAHVDAIPPARPLLSAEPPAALADPVRGRRAIQQYGCVSCHVIPGVIGANEPVGPPLKGIASRRYLSGTLPNTPEHMLRWLRAPSSVDPRTAMPDLQVSERDARDMAAYLQTLR